MENNQGTVLIVDDERLNINLLVDLLTDSYTTLVAKNGQQAIKRANSDPTPELILLDIMMPDMDGYEVLQRLKSEEKTKHIPVIFVTAMGEVDDETKGFEMGAVDYITKPYSPPVVKARVRTHLSLTQATHKLAEYSHTLEDKVDKRTRQLVLTQDVTIHALASLAETRDNETGNHIRRTQHYVLKLARELSKYPKYSQMLDEKTIQMLFKSAPLHDMGKVGIPDNILLKPGKLTDDEFTVMKSHTTLGYEAISIAEGSLGNGDSFLRFIREIAYTHHEKWDGSGYPNGLKGDDIPLSGRLMAIADVYDALISKRVYKPAFSHEKAIAIISEGGGSHFEQEIVDIFIKIADSFQETAREFSDSKC
jgi:putative two-component system response regulator